MSTHPIEIIGLTDPCNFPACHECDDYITFCETDRLCIPPQKPNIFQILSVCISLKICNCKTVATPVGFSLFVDAIKEIKVMYTAATQCHSVHTAHFMLPFCFCIPLECTCNEVCDIYTAILCVSTHKLDCRSLAISPFIFACPLQSCCSDCPPCCDMSCGHPLHTTIQNPCYCSQPPSYCGCCSQRNNNENANCSSTSCQTSYSRSVNDEQINIPETNYTNNLNPIVYGK